MQPSEQGLSNVSEAVDTADFVRAMEPLRLSTLLREPPPPRSISRLILHWRAKPRQRRIALVGPMPLRAVVASLLPDGIVQAEQPAALPPSEQLTDVIVCGPAGQEEDTCFAEAVRVFGAADDSGVRVHRFFADVLVNRLAGLDPLFGSVAPLALDWNAYKPYAVVCTGRSGSSHLCELLTSTGVCGRPAEHLREPMIHAITHGHVNLDDLLRRLVVAQATANGVFGTKIISRFILELIKTVPVETLRRRLPPLQVVYLGRRDKVAQAASTIRARISGRWHATGKTPQVCRIELSSAQLDEALAEYRSNLERQRQLDDLVDSLFPEARLLRIWYEDLIDDPRDIVRRVCDHLGMENRLDHKRISSRHRKIPAEDRIYEQIEQALGAAVDD